jgi:hypothetical protein
MKYKTSHLQVIIIVGCFLFSACHLKQDPEYRLFSKTYYRHGQLWSGILKQPAVVQSYPCTGRVAFDSAGRINEFILSEDHEMHGHILPRNSIVNIYWNTENVILPEPMDIQGYHVAGGKYAYLSFIMDTFGNMIMFIPEDDVEINGILCRGQNSIELYPDGRLWVCTLAREYESNGTHFPPDTRLLIDRSGKAQEYSWELYTSIRRQLGL